MTEHNHTVASLRAGLDQAARSFDVPGGDVDSVMRRSDRRAQRRRRLVAGMTALALVAGAVGALDLLDGGDPEVSVASGGGLTQGDAGIAWRTVSPSSGLGYARGSVSTSGAGAGPVYAISTAPGQAAPNVDPQRVVWRSDDGVEWSAVTTLSGDLFLADLATRDDRVYAVGTGPATAAAGDRPTSPLLVGWSDDGARTWTRHALPLDLAALSSRTVASGVGNASVAAGPSGTVVMASVFAQLDVPSVLPPGAAAPNGWVLTDTGVDVLGPERPVACPAGTSAPAEQKPQPPPEARAEVWPSVCLADDGSAVQIPPQQVRGVEASYTWEQLHVDGDLLQAVRHQPFAFAAAPGSDRFERVALPPLDEVQGPLMLDTDDAGFDLVTTTTGRILVDGSQTTGIVVLHSADGRSWERSSAPADDMWATAAGRVGGVATIVGQRRSGAVLLRSDGAGGWTTTPLAAALAHDVPEGFEMYVMSAAIGPFGIVAAVHLEPGRRAVSRPVDLEEHILVSRDGRTWDDRTAAELTDRAVTGVLRASVVGDRAIVAVSVASEPGRRREQVVLVGTPS
ncbi:MAG TPA: hypothetical protein VHM89_12605 [Acidimicrobiales bacterium]|nr:hypothetical protein [Acidimicrobiales bacterium]